MPEPGFAWALYYQVAHDDRRREEGGRMGAGRYATDLRQLALVFDWCGPVMTKAQADRLAAKIETALALAPLRRRPTQQSARALAAIAIADRLPDQRRSGAAGHRSNNGGAASIVKQIGQGQPADSARTDLLRSMK